jgi:hypothetical protein
MSTTPFTTFAFPATGAPSPSGNRNMPDRLAEVKNVKDFGATGDGGTDDTAAIQAAVDATSGANRGTIFFPAGTYKLLSSVTYNYNGNLAIEFVGEGAASSIQGAFNGYMFDRHNVNSGSPNYTNGLIGFRGLSMNNGNNAGGGAIRMGSTNGGYVRDCFLSGFTCFTSEDSPGNSSQSILLDNVQISGVGTTGCKGFVTGGTGAMINCSATQCAIAALVYGNGLLMAGNRWERNDTGVQFGLDSAGTDRGASGFVVFAGSNEGPLTGFYLAGTCSGFYLAAAVLGHPGNAGMVSGNTQYGIRVGNKCSAGVFSNCSTAQWVEVAGIEIAAASSRANLLFSGCLPSGAVGTGVNWILPTNAYTAQFENCSVNPIWTYSQLPTGANVLEGDEFNISDPNTATWGANVTASGSSGRILVRWNGSNYTVVGK